jgi:hypothetical protein
MYESRTDSTATSGVASRAKVVCRQRAATRQRVRVRPNAIINWEFRFSFENVRRARNRARCPLGTVPSLLAGAIIRSSAPFDFSWQSAPLRRDLLESGRGGAQNIQGVDQVLYDLDHVMSVFLARKETTMRSRISSFDRGLEYASLVLAYESLLIQRVQPRSEGALITDLMLNDNI